MISRNELAPIARDALMSWATRETLLSRPLTSVAEDDDALATENARVWIEYLRELAPEDASRELWRTAIAGRASTWRALYAMLDPHLSRIAAEMDRIVAQMPGDSEYRAIVQEILRTWPASAAKTPSSVIWILAIAQSVTGEIDPAIYPLAAAAAFYYQGVVILDDVADGELQPICSGWPRGQAEHLAYSLAGALPLISIERTDVPPEKRASMISELSQAIWITNIGQFQDLRQLGPVTLDIEQSIEIARMKTGLGIARLTRMAGHFFGLDEAVIDRWEQATLCFATARQVASDVCDIWHKPVSPDLVTGKCTLPIAITVECLAGSPIGERFAEMRRSCQYQHDAHPSVRLLMEQHDVLGWIMTWLAAKRASGVELLDELGVSDPARSWILTWSSQACVFGDIC